MSNVVVNERRISVFALLGLLFVGLKLTGHIEWSWWLVTLPFWIVPAIIFAVVGVAGAIWLIATLMESK